MINVFFYSVELVAMMSSFLMVLSKNPARSALFLVLCFFASSILWLMAGSEFLALILILVYVGAVMTLFLFVIMMLDIEKIFFKPNVIKYFGVSLIICCFTLGLMYVLIDVHDLLAIADVSTISNTESIGRVLYTHYAYPFVIAGVLLLVAIISSVALVHRSPRNRATQNPVKQMQTKRDKRVKLVDVKRDEQIIIEQSRSNH